jgi:hypothetical protein
VKQKIITAIDYSFCAILAVVAGSIALSFWVVSVTGENIERKIRKWKK